MPFSNPVMAGKQIVRNAMQSLGFVVGVSGWQLQRNGDAQFNDVTITGTFAGIDWEINNDGAFFYAGTPAAGNLILSLAAAAGSDQFGNVYPELIGLFPAGSGSGFGLKITDSGLSTPQIEWFAASSVPNSDPTIYALPSKALGCLLVLFSGLANATGAPATVNLYDSTGFNSLVGIAEAAVELVADIVELQSASGSHGPVIFLAQAADQPPAGAQTLGQAGLFAQPGVKMSIVSSSGAFYYISGSKAAMVTGTTVANAAKTSLGFMLVKANDIGGGTTHQIHAAGFYSTGASVPSSATFGVWWGGITGTLLASIVPPTIIASASNANWILDCELNWLSASSVHISVILHWRTAGGIGGSAVFETTATVTGLTTTSDQNLSVSFQWGTAPASTSLSNPAIRFGAAA